MMDNVHAMKEKKVKNSKTGVRSVRRFIYNEIGISDMEKVIDFSDL